MYLLIDNWSIFIDLLENFSYVPLHCDIPSWCKFYMLRFWIFEKNTFIYGVGCILFGLVDQTYIAHEHSMIWNQWNFCRFCNLCKRYYNLTFVLNFEACRWLFSFYILFFLFSLSFFLYFPFFLSWGRGSTRQVKLTTICIISD